ncbi:FOG: WD40-like repeat protein [Mycobacterium tuberculosis]|nr:FOG: WD40-like repeat protein [Mycobacterium tuberculosis]
MSASLLVRTACGGRAVAQRLRTVLWPITQTSVVAGLAWYLTHDVFNHPQAFFAPISAVVCMSATNVLRARRAQQMIVGVALGIVLGAGVHALLGSGPIATVVVSVWQPGEPAAKLVGLKYHAEQLVREWTSDAVSAGVLASPVLSADGSTVYVNGRDHRLWALNAADGKAKWSAPLGFLAQTPPALTPHGLIVSGGGPDTALAAFRDAGDHAEGAWRRDDVTALSTASLAGTGVGYTVISGPNHDGTPGLSLLVFDPANGHTVNSYPLPGATGYPVGVSVGNDRRVVTATSDGQVYSFAP